MRWSERAALVALALIALGRRPGRGTTQAARGCERPLPITPVGLVGRWSDSGDCAKFVIFRSDGTFLARDGGQGTWRLVRGRLTLAGARRHRRAHRPQPHRPADGGGQRRRQHRPLAALLTAAKRASRGAGATDALNHDPPTCYGTSRRA